MGVSKEADVDRSLRVTAVLSTLSCGVSAYLYPKFPNSSMLRLWVFVIEKLGDQVNASPIVTGFDEMLSVGNVRSISDRPGYCFCVPPMLMFAGPNACW